MLEAVVPGCRVAPCLAQLAAQRHDGLDKPAPFSSRRPGRERPKQAQLSVGAQPSVDVLCRGRMLMSMLQMREWVGSRGRDVQLLHAFGDRLCASSQCRELYVWVLHPP